MEDDDEERAGKKEMKSKRPLITRQTPTHCTQLPINTSSSFIILHHPWFFDPTFIHPILKERRRDDPSFFLFGSSHPRSH